jgi:outer membrane protein OmpA-like peptidoglycan-associated protein
VDRPLNDKLPNGICAVSPDGNTLTVINAYYDDGNVEDGVSVSRKTASGWSFPRKQEIEDYYNLGEYQDYFVSNSGKVLISAVQREDSRGEQDLYVSFRTGEDSWSKPVNMGKVINTPKVEFAPFLASDNKTLYFASNGHRGFGESDIFYTRRQDDTWTNWSVPENIGKSINSFGWDGYYTISAKGDYAYFISTAGALNKVDFNPTDEDIFRISLDKEAKPDPVVLVKGKVINSKTKQPIEADIFYESIPSASESGIAISDPVNGNYKIVLPVGKKYGFRAEAEGYIAVSQNEDFTIVDEYREIERVLELTPLEVGEVVQLNNIFFAQSKADILPESEPELERLLTLLKENASLEIELGGHTDNRGSSAANLDLSQERALSIVKYLINHGIVKKRLEFKGYGGTKPLASNASEESRRKNRRVEIKVLKF